MNLLNCGDSSLKIKLNGGLGNQLFQFAMGTNLALTKLSNISFEEDNQKWESRLEILGIQTNTTYRPQIIEGRLDFLENKKCKNCHFSKYNEENFHYSPINLKRSHTIFKGYFQSELYFVENRDYIKEFIREKIDFQIGPVEEENLIQIRLGDMARDEKVRRVHGIINDDYIAKAIGLLNLNYSDFQIISNDFELIPTELPLTHEAGLKYVKELSDIRDFKRLMKAKNLIISNSTFGWWGAWLGDSNVVAPRDWFTQLGLQEYSTRDLFPDGWILV